MELHDYRIYYVNIDLCHQYGISVADVPPGETFLAARRYEKRLYSQAKRWGAHQKIKQNVQITTSDKNPSAGFVIKPRTIVQITKNVTNMDPVTFWAKASDHSCVLNNQPSLIVIPVEKMGIWKVVNITDKCKLVSSF